MLRPSGATVAQPFYQYKVPSAGLPAPVCWHFFATAQGVAVAKAQVSHGRFSSPRAERVAEVRMSGTDGHPYALARR